jgi:putative ABC transport system permease protein
MNTPLLMKSVTSRLWRFKGRTISMGLGITIGVLATVVLQAVAGTLEGRFLAFINRAYPADAVVLMAGGGPMSRSSGGAKLKLADVETAAASLGVTDWDPLVFAGPRDVKHGANSASISVIGHSEKAESVRRESAAEGEFFSADDIRGRAAVALLGKTAAKTLFPGEPAVGAQLFIDNVPFTVKGVLEPNGVDVHGNDQDNVIQVPYTTLMEKMLRVTSISAATMLLGDAKRVGPAQREITRLIRERHQIAEGQKDDFVVLTSDSIMTMFNRSFRTLRIFVPLIAATAFIISALVILAIMQLSIKARVSEIGLRKAVGARDRDLRLQLFLEVIMVSAVASAFGLLLAEVGIAALTPTLAVRFGVKHVSTPLVLLAVAVAASIATGVLGSLLPARRAAAMNPVEALRTV